MPEREKVIEDVETAFDIWIDEYEGTSYYDIAKVKQAKADALALLKEQEAVVKQWTKEIADNQLAHAPDELDIENWDYKKGIWDGLQIAWNIISEGR